jgi:hypothetical protein
MSLRRENAADLSVDGAFGLDALQRLMKGVSDATKDRSSATGIKVVPLSFTALTCPERISS